MATKKPTVWAYPLQWPQGWPRASNRSVNNNFKQTRESAGHKLVAEIGLMQAKHLVISTNARLNAEGRPRGDENPNNPGVAAYFERKGKQVVFACDRFLHIEDNLNALALTIGALRGIERWGASEMMERAFSGFKQLAAENEGPSWWGVLGVRAGATAAEIDAAYRELAKKAHPDLGGNDAEMSALNAARQQGLNVAAGR